MALPPLLVVLLLCPALSASREALPLDHDEASVLSALAGDDECLAGPDGSLDAGCGLHALQFRGRRQPPGDGAALQSSGVRSPAEEAAATQLPAAPRAATQATADAAAKDPAASGHAGSSVLAPCMWHRLLQDTGLGTTALLRVAEVLGFLALGAILASELFGRLRHHARFRSCQRKVQHVHRELVRQDHDLPLCPYCIESVQSQRSSDKVVFLCGHSFHLPCANRFFREHQERTGLCPICCEGMAKVGFSSLSLRSSDFSLDQCAQNAYNCSVQADAAAPAPAVAVPKGGAAAPPPEGGAAAPPEGGGAAAEGGGAAGGSLQPSALQECDRSFLLTNLQRMYPEIISEACMLRWASCHVEIWLQELTRPKYKSVLCRCC